MKSSINENIRDLWSDSTKSNIRPDSLLSNFTLKQALKVQKETQTQTAVDHFLGLESQGQIAKTVSELIPAKQIANWSKTLNLLPGHIYNFARKAIQSQLPTFSNLQKWGRAPSNLCPMCDKVQSNKHVLSNCGSSGALSRFTLRHDKILEIITDWINCNLSSNKEIYHDLQLPRSKHISDLFTNLRPDIAIKSESEIVILELTICHESNFLSSRKYKLNKYRNIQNHRSELIKHLPVTVCTCEISVLGFVVMEPKFLTKCGLPAVDNTLTNKLSMSALTSSFHIYTERNM